MTNITTGDRERRAAILAAAREAGSVRRRPVAVAKASPRDATLRRAAVAASVLLVGALALGLSGQSRAASAAVELESPRIDQGNEKSLQRGARAFVNYCMGCHSAGYQRYSRMAQDLGLSEEDVERNLIFTTDENGEPTKVGALMTNAMTKDYGQQAFGVAPPNLALTARSRGTDWIYTFLKTFYVDPDRAGTGVNNLVYPGTAMPHVLWPLQGWQVLDDGSDDAVETLVAAESAEAGHTETDDDAGAGLEEAHQVAAAPVLKLESEGTLTPDEYEDLIADITNFLAYMSDPIKETRHRIGIFVMLFLFALLAVTYFLKREYWKDVV